MTSEVETGNSQGAIPDILCFLPDFDTSTRLRVALDSVEIVLWWGGKEETVDFGA